MAGPFCVFGRSLENGSGTVIESFCSANVLVNVEIRLADYPGEQKTASGGVILNLVQNSIEAMTGVTGRRIISVVTSRHGANAVPMSDRVFGQRRKGRHYKHEECL